MTQLDPISSDWLALRERADDRARDATTATLLPALRRSLTGGDSESGGSAQVPVLVVDLGTGTGANPRWLMPRLSVPQTWLLVDHDQDLLAELTVRLTGNAAPWTSVVSDVAHLREVLTQHRRPGQAVLLTCAALLDLLDARTVDEFAGVLQDFGAHGLFSLTVDGGGSFTPARPLDDAVQAVFNAHQQRHGHLGPDGVEALRQALGRAGEDTAGEAVTVTVQQTDWILDAADAGDRALIERLLQDRAAAVRDHVGSADYSADESGRREMLSASDVDAWLTDRLQATHGGALRVRVGHQDVLVAPRG
ncbi:hypothetical protein BKD30_13430 [Tersicoccus phoenicis]|uniref:Methyltransferase domain-containing protein n=1 Tax=Tersicoccus phoenicis TaxID=554083 RepID=A0A1R1L713_9MICC|nr:hypothetical protein [Tersicoccus phoenicis]OMH23332.1 hypothetical protein BKD30_13430 [Tersicoccus phoenicis]